MTSGHPPIPEDPWLDDVLDRRREAEHLIGYIDARLADLQSRGKKRAYVLNLDAQWGGGKTFFLERLQRHLARQKRLSAYVNAWADDHTEDPLISVMLAVEEAMEPHLGQPALAKKLKGIQQNVGSILWAAARSGSRTYIERRLGIGMEDLLEVTTSGNTEALGSGVDSALRAASVEIDRLTSHYADERIAALKKARLAIDSFKCNLEDLLATVGGQATAGPTLFILIDELDRCRPTYALEMLERIKHIFDVSDVVFVVATDTGQLSSAVKAVYGESFDSPRYLRRFFDRTYLFGQADVSKFVENLQVTRPIELERLSVPASTLPSEVLATIFDSDGLTLRDVEQCYEMLRAIESSWTNEFELELTFLLPLIIANRLGVDRPVTGAFSTEIRRELIDLRGRSESAFITLKEVDVRGDRAPDKSYDVWALFDEFDRACDRPLKEFIESWNGVHRIGPVRYLLERLNVELSCRRRSEIDAPSAITHYENMVKQAGRAVGHPLT